jgi:hypothetical protein
MHGSDLAWAEGLALHSKADHKYAKRFAKAPAIDGLLNAFTIPLHGWMYVLAPGGGHMSEYGAGGGRTRFGRLLEELQKMRVVSQRSQRVRIPRGAVRYKIHLKRLRRATVQSQLNNLQADKFRTKRLRKVFRYLRVASRSKPHRYIGLDRWLYDHDRQGSVLQRLNRWVDAGYLRLAPGINDRYEIRLLATRRSLSGKMIRTICLESKRWAEHKNEGVKEMMRVLKARSPQQRQRHVLKYFDEPAWRRFKYDRTLVASLPKWILSR